MSDDSVSCTWCSIELPGHMMHPVKQALLCPKCNANFHQALHRARDRMPYDVPDAIQPLIDVTLREEKAQKQEKRAEAVTQLAETARESQERVARIAAHTSEYEEHHRETVAERSEAEQQQVEARAMAKRELARRALAAKHLLPFVKYNMPSYESGWVHKDICRRLEKFSEDVARGRSPRLMLAMPPRHGKQLADATPVITPRGFKTHGELRPGDEVFHPSGRSIRVTGVSEKTPSNWVMEFSNGEQIRCHGNHEWTVYDRTQGHWRTETTKWFLESLQQLPGTGRPVFQLPEAFSPTELRRLTIKTVNYDPNGEWGHCIEVDSHDGLYLAGATLIPTHNSELASKNFPAWHLGRNPTHDVITASYSAALATDFSKKVRSLAKSKEYESIFPGNGVDPENQNAEGWSTRKGGMYVPAGVEGPITGRGAHCFPTGTPVQTPEGEVKIDQLLPGMSVYTCNLADGSIGVSPVAATSSHYAPDRLVEITTASGKRVRATRGHRFFVPTVGWVEAKDLRPGDPVALLTGQSALRALSRPGGRLPGEAPERGSRKAVPDRQRNVPAHAESQRTALSQSVHSEAAESRVQFLPVVRDGVSAEESPDAVLYPDLREPGALKTDARRGGLTLQRWHELRSVVRFDATVDTGAGRWVRNLRPIGIRAAHPSHQPRPDGQPCVELDHAVRQAPYDSPQVALDTVSAVAVVGEPDELVYDIQVAGTHCFFAGQILVHNCLIIDDPTKNREEAESASRRQAIKDWYTSTAYTRLAPGGGILIIQTRWHEGDLSGWLLDEMEAGTGDEWEVIKYPAIATEDEPYRCAGDPLHPERYPLDALARIKKAVGRRDWMALYQQDPVSEEGDYFTGSDFQYYKPEDLPELHTMTVYAAWDLAIGKKETNDFSVGVVVGIDRNLNLWLLDLYRGRWGSLEIVEKLFECYDKWDPSIIGIERTHVEQAIGPLIEEQKRQRRKFGMRIEPLKPGRRDKRARAQPIRGLIEMHRVYFPKLAPWLDDFISEMLKFDNGKHDDCVDAIAWIGQMVQMFNPKPLPRAKPKKTWRDNLRKHVNNGVKSGSHMSS